MQDSVQRTVNGAVSAGASSITFDTPARPLINGEGVTFAGHSTEYVVSNCTSSTFTVTPALTSGILDQEKITRVDPYRLVELDDILDEFLPDAKDGISDPRAAALYKYALRTREYLEQRTEHVFKARTITEVHSVDRYYQDTLILKYSPIVSVTSVSYEYIGDSSATTIESDDYSVNTELGTIYYPYFPKGQNHLTVVYRAGWETIRQDHSLNFMQLFTLMYAFSNKGKDALILQSNSKLETTNRSLSEIDEFIDRNFPQRRVRI